MRKTKRKTKKVAPKKRRVKGVKAAAVLNFNKLKRDGGASKSEFKRLEELNRLGLSAFEAKAFPSPPSAEAQLTQALTRLCDEIAPEFKQRLSEAESENWRLKQAYDNLSRRLIKMLTEEQLEAAKISFCKPEVYALEWVMMLKDECRIQPPLRTSNYQS